MSLGKDFKDVSGLVSEVVLDSLETMSALGFVIIDEQGKIIKANQMAKDLLGIDEVSQNKICWDSFFSPEDRQTELSRSHQIICAKEGEYHVHSSLLSASGEKIDACLVYKSIPKRGAVGGESRGVCIFIKNNSYVRKLEQEVYKLRNQLPLGGNQAALVRDLCHKLRSPLTLISLSVNLLRDYSDEMSGQERAEELQQIEEGLAACQNAIAGVALTAPQQPQKNQTHSSS